MTLRDWVETAFGRIVHEFETGFLTTTKDVWFNMVGELAEEIEGRPEYATYEKTLEDLVSKAR